MHLRTFAHWPAFAWIAALLAALCVLARAQASPEDKQGAPSDKQAAADQSGSEEEQGKALARAVQNPVASLISVPLQNNTNFDIGPKQSHSEHP